MIPVKFPQYQSTGTRQLTPERLQFFRAEDFKGASVLDIGCNEGLFEEFTKSCGARKYTGVDGDESFSKENIYRLNLDDHNDLLILEAAQADVVLLLAVTHWLKYPMTVTDIVLRIANRVIYYEGHQQEYVEDKFEEYFRDSPFKWEKLGETPGRRPFYRGERI